MPVPKPRYSKEEFARLGDEIYDQEISLALALTTKVNSWSSTLRREHMRLIRTNWQHLIGFLHWQHLIGFLPVDSMRKCG